MNTRVDVLLSTVEKQHHILELSPSYSPLCSKLEGWQVKTVDHCDESELRIKYKDDPGVNVNKIEPVDFVWNESLLENAIPEEFHGTFDVLISSHVLEHIPNPLGFFNSAEKILKPDGELIMALPDKRYCFDYLRHPTTTSQIIHAFEQKRTRHTQSAIFDYFASQCTTEFGLTWGQFPLKSLEFLSTLQNAYTKTQQARMNTEYIDAHGWVFMPSSLQLIFLELGCLGLTDWRIEHLSEATGCEFYIKLKRGAKKYLQSFSEADINKMRKTCHEQQLLELREQINYYLPVASTLPVETQNQNYVDWHPKASNAVKLFEGEWSSILPGFQSGGAAELFNDGRIDWFEEQHGSFAGQQILELGPLEGGNTTMLAQRGAKVLSIDANKKAFQRCLVVKDLYQLQDVSFLLGDFTKFLESNTKIYDFTLASGVLYHMQDPVKTLHDIAASSHSIGIWTHYYDAELIQAKDHMMKKFEHTPEQIKYNKQTHNVYKYFYNDALHWDGFCGGMQNHSCWMTKDSILSILEALGFTCTIGMEHRDHPNGPAFCVFARRQGY